MKILAITLVLCGGWDMLAPPPSQAGGGTFDMLLLGERPQASAARTAAEPAAVSAKHGPVRAARPLPRRLVVYTARWCGPCRTFEHEVLPKLVAAGWRVGDGPRNHITLIACDGCLPPGIEALPTFVLIEHGRETDRRVGLLDEWDVGEFVKGYSERPGVEPRQTSATATTR